MKFSLCTGFAAMALILGAGPAPSDAAVYVPGQKIDSGLGNLAHYATWADKSGRTVHVLGESLDDGLGELPHYSQWVDPTGRDPMGQLTIRLSQARR